MMNTNKEFMEVISGSLLSCEDYCINGSGVACYTCTRFTNTEFFKNLVEKSKNKKDSIVVFVSSPYSKDEENNLKKHIEIGNALLDKGYGVCLPLLYHYLNKEKLRPYQEWLEITQRLISRCDLLLCTGVSEGTKSEVEYAKELSIPVVWSIEEITNYIS